MTLADLLAAVSSDLGYEAIPSAVVTARLTRYLNDGYRQLLSMPELAPLRQSTLPFTSVPGQTAYGVSSALQTIQQVVNTTSATRLRLMTLDEFRTLDPQETASGTPTHYVPLGMRSVKLVPDVSTVLYLSSQDPTDTTQIVTISAILRDGTFFGKRTVALNGTTLVAAGGGSGPDTSFIVQQWTLNVPAHGSVLLSDGPVATHIYGVIPAGQLSVQYLAVRLWPTPSAADNYQIDGVVGLFPLELTTDVPLIPEDFQDILGDFARMREYEYRDDSRYAMASQGYQEKLKYLRDRVCNPPDYRPRVGRLGVRGNNLDANGVNYPPGRF